VQYTDDQLARVAHAANIAMQELWADDMPSLPWMWEPRAHRRTVLAGISRVRRAGLSARENHQLWLEDKRRQGWILGEKDPDARTHPDLLDWEDLPEEARDKAELFVAVVRALSREE
jgi:RyR domain